MPTVDLTLSEKRVASAEVGMYRDTACRTLYLRVSPTSRTFSYYAWSKADQMPMRVSLGGWPALTVEAARVAAKEHDARNAAGQSLRKVKSAPVVPEVELTLGQIVTRHTARLKREGKRSVDWLADAVRLSFSDWGTLPLSAISTRKLEDRISHIHDTRGPGASRTALKAIRALYSAASDRMGYEGRNPAKAITTAPQVARQRVLDADEKARFLAALDAETVPYLKPFFMILMKTGCRRGNLESAEWSEFDFDARWWTVPAGTSKSGKVMKVRLREDVVAILRELQDAPGAHARWVFPSPVIPDAPICDSWFQFRRVATAAGLPSEGPDKVTPHDLRRSFGSDLMAAGVPLAVVSKALGHGSIRTTLRHYVVAGDGLVGSEVDRVDL